MDLRWKRSGVWVRFGGGWGRCRQRRGGTVLGEVTGFGKEVVMGWKEIGVWVERERRDGFGGGWGHGFGRERIQRKGGFGLVGLGGGEAHGLVEREMVFMVFGVEEEGGSVLVAEKGELVRFWRRLGFEGVAMEVWVVGMKKRG
ncbi:uncharacterized protein G2W53_029069 [Senna tora]|uniref:Uncharacterized protein n=1 Tax=Senna tora TaxID=362788 RepID=A0A834T534_9FABA|nr:uncharacterized protein G2W53_029069 [Senna tora]